MATVFITPLIQSYVECPPMVVYENSVRDVLEAYFQKHQRVRHFILDDQSCLRPRLSVFVDGVLAMDRIGLGDPVHLNARVYVQHMPLDSDYEIVG
jgi:sulfur-carrier protein